MGNFFTGHYLHDNKTRKFKDYLHKIDELHENQERLDRLMKAQSDLIEEIYKLKAELLNELQQQPQQHEQQRLREENDRLRAQISSLISKSEEAERQQNMEVQKRRNQSVPVFMYSTAMNSNLTERVSDELEKILTNQMEGSKDRKISITRVSEPQELAADKPIIVICINASRIGTDVKNALQGVPYSQNAVVAIIHHKEVHALPAQISEKLLIGEEYKKLGAIIDIAYITNKGMYPCDMNNRSLDRLTDFICKFFPSP